MNKYKNHVPITTEMHKELLAHKTRTGIGAIVIHRYMTEHDLFGPRNKITVQRIESWFTGIAKKTVEEDFKVVIDAYEALDANYATPRCSAQRIPIDKGFLENLKYAFRSRQNFSVASFLKHNNAPKSLTATKLYALISGKTQTIAIPHKEFLEKAITAINTMK